MSKKTEKRTCEFCGTEFFAEKRRVDIGLAKFCSPVCGAKARKPKHGHTTHNRQSSTYTTYQNMVGRCHREGHSKYSSYGENGIRVCDRWRESFANFLEDMGERPDGTTIDRIDGALGYYPDNCRWATPKMQQANICTNVNLTYLGKTKNVSAWAEEFGIDKSNLSRRVKAGWTIEEALNTPEKFGNRIKKTGQVLHEYCGKTQCIAEWAREYGLSVSLLRLRLGKGWTIEKSLKEPKGLFDVKKVHLESTD